MAILWDQSLTPWTDPNGDPHAGASVYFYDAGTTTPLVTYTEASLSIPHDHPVVADASGSFPAIFLPEQITYRIRILTADGETLHDVDFISSPTTVPAEVPEGDTPVELLFRTGDIKMAWRTSAPSGFVRLNGRTIGSGASSATERANADCEDLFVHLWTNDANLAVSGGRGASAAGDWAAAKNIAVPDFRGRVPAGLDSMGNSASGRITDAQLGADSDTLGSAGGAASHALTTGELASHTHTGTTNSDGAHIHGTSASLAHRVTAATAGGSSVVFADGIGTAVTVTNTSSAHQHAFTTASQGSGTAHNNLQPTVVVPFFIKL